MANNCLSPVDLVRDWDQSETRGERHRARERGQASIELVTLILLLSLAFAAAAALSPVMDGRALVGFLTHHLFCAATRGCDALGGRH